MSKHTPGPWRVDGSAIIGKEPPGDGVCVVPLIWYGPERRAEIEANARLIAAAPEMLEALECLASEVYEAGDPTAIENAYAVIAKAKETPANG